VEFELSHTGKSFLRSTGRSPLASHRLQLYGHLVPPRDKAGSGNFPIGARRGYLGEETRDLGGEFGVALGH
jgi:hypothetical protein